jgi:hypothetical protein
MKNISSLIIASLVIALGLPGIGHARGEDGNKSESRGENRSHGRDDSRDSSRDPSREGSSGPSQSGGSVVSPSGSDEVSRNNTSDDIEDKETSSPPAGYTNSSGTNFGSGVSLVTRDEDNEQDSARNQVRRGNIKKLSDVMAAVKQQVPGDVVSVKLKGKSEAPIYELKILTNKNELKKIRVDARSLSIY